MEDFWSPLQATIEEICLDFDKVWQTRKRVITTQFLVTLGTVSVDIIIVSCWISDLKYDSWLAIYDGWRKDKIEKIVSCY